MNLFKYYNYNRLKISININNYVSVVNYLISIGFNFDEYNIKNISDIHKMVKYHIDKDYNNLEIREHSKYISLCNSNQYIFNFKNIDNLIRKEKIKILL